MLLPPALPEGLPEARGCTSPPRAAGAEAGRQGKAVLGACHGASPSPATSPRTPKGQAELSLPRARHSPVPPRGVLCPPGVCKCAICTRKKALPSHQSSGVFYHCELLPGRGREPHAGMMLGAPPAPTGPQAVLATGSPCRVAQCHLLVLGKSQLPHGACGVRLQPQGPGCRGCPLLGSSLGTFCF